MVKQTNFTILNRVIVYIMVPIILVFSGEINASAQNLVWSKKCSQNQKETYTVAFSADGKKIFSGSEHLPTSVRIFDTDNGNILWDDTLASGLMCAQDITFNSNSSRIIVLEEYGNILVYDNTTVKPTLLQSIKTPTTAAFTVVLSPDGNKIAVSCSDKKMITYNVNNAALLRNIDAHLNYAYGVDWSVNNQIVTCGDDLLIKLWDTTGTLIRTFSGHTQSVRCVKFTPDGSRIVSCSRDNSIRIWDVTSGNLLKTLTGHSKIVRQVDISEDGTKIVSCDEDGIIKTWNLMTGSLEKSFNSSTSKGIVYSVKFRPGSTRYLAAGNTEGDVQFWDLLFPTNLSQANLQTSHTVVYPNPFAELLNVHSNKGIIQNALLVDVTGKVLLTGVIKSTHNAAFHTGDLKQGVYFLSIQTGNGNFSHKIVKE